jgi:hypothetical protein
MSPYGVLMMPCTPIHCGLLLKGFKMRAQQSQVKQGHTYDIKVQQSFPSDTYKY